MNKKLHIRLMNRDELLASYNNNKWKLEAKGCLAFLRAVDQLRKVPDFSQYSLPEEKDHVSLMIKEFLLRLRGEWELPYKEEELCHCRQIATEFVDQAIVAGNHDLQSIGKQCQAGITCGSCKPDIEDLLKYRLS